MKHTALIFRLLVLGLGMLLLPLRSDAQTYGDNCMYPIVVTGLDTTTSISNANRAQSWYCIGLNMPVYSFTVTDVGGSPGTTEKLILYRGQCNSLVPVDSVLRLPQDTALTLKGQYPEPGYYFVKALHSGTPTNAPATQTRARLHQETAPSFCGFDERNSMLRAAFPNYTVQMSAQDQYIYNYITTHTNIAGPFTIPVVVHVMHFGDAYGTGNNVPYEQIQWQIAAMNAAFQKAYPAYNQEQHGHQYTFGYQDYSVNTQVRFCLATIGRNASLNTIPFYFNTTTSQTEAGVMRYDLTQAPFSNVPNVATLNEIDMNNPADEQAIINLTRPGTEFPNAMYFNIYLVPDICADSSCNNLPDSIPGIVGFGNMAPSSFFGLDGVVIRADAFGDNSVVGNSFSLFTPLEKGKIMVHEAGHYLALYHTFQPDTLMPLGCYGMNLPNNSSDQCDRHGDYCCDTPPDANDVIWAYTQGPGFINSCNEAYFTNPINRPDMLENYMDYADDEWYNTFTYNQAMRASAMLDVGGPRHSLVTTTNNNLTGVSNTGVCTCCVLDATINPQIDTTCVGGAVNFITPSGVGLCATSWNWQFPGGSPATATGASASTIYNTTGTYQVILTATDGVNSVTDTATVVVIIPTVSIASANTNLTVCRGNKQSINLVFNGNLPPYSVSICNAANQVVATMSNITDATAIIQVPVTATDSVFHICSATNGLGCLLDTISATISYNTTECCPNLFVNGDFEDWGQGCNINPGLTTQLTWLQTCNVYSPNYYGIYNPSNQFGSWPVVPGMGGSNGNSMVIDGHSIPPVPFPISHSILYQETINLINGTTYSLQFDYSGHFSNLASFNPPSPSYRLYLQIKINNTFIGTPIQVPVSSLNSPWRTTVLDWVCTLPNGAYQIAVCQVAVPFSGINFASGGFDYLIDNVTIRSKDIPFVFAGSDTTICSNSTVNIGSALNDSNGVYSWQPQNFVTCPTCSLTTANPTSSTQYVLTNQLNGCVVRDTVSIGLMTVDAGNDTSTCGGSAIQLTAIVTGNTGPYTILWMPGSLTTPSIFVFPSVPTTYTVTVTDTITGCTATDSVIVYAFTSPAIILPIPAACEGSPAFSLLPFASPVGGVFSTSLFTGNTFDPSLHGVGNHLLSYIYTDSLTGCTRTDTAIVSVIPCCPPPAAAIVTTNQQLSSSYGAAFSPVPVPVQINGVFIVDNNFTIFNHRGVNAVQLAPGAEIIVQNGATLTIDTSLLKSCGAGMWQGITVRPLGVLNILNKSIIQDAIETVTIENGAQYTITESVFQRNYRNLIVEPYAGYHPGIFEYNHITGTILTLSPHIGTRTFYGIEVTDVDSIVFGAPGFASNYTNTNILSGMQIGMHLVRSNVVNTNMFMNQIVRTTAPTAIPVCCSLNNCTNPAVCNPAPIGTAIHQQAGRLWMRNNNGAPFEAVTFNSVNIGVKAEGSASMHLTGNYFMSLTNSNTNSIPSAGVWVLRDTVGTIILDSNTVFTVVQGFVMQLTDHCTILIRENNFDKFVNGVRVIQQNKCGIKIGNNRFNTASNSNFGTNAIRLQTAVATSSTDSTQVYANTIYRCKTGVWLTSYKDAFINETNSIWFGSVTPATPEYGIRVQNSRNTTVDGNAIVRSGANPNSNTALRDNLYGISMQTGCQNSVVSNNGVMRLGTGIEFAWAGNFPATMSCNTMTWNMAGARFTNSFIGDQGSPVGNGTVHDNQWTFILSPNNHKTLYQTGSPTANWYSRTGVSLVNPTTFPQTISQQPLGFYNFVGSFPSAPQTCASNNDGNQSTTRQAKLADLALRNQPFDQMYEDELRMYDEQAFYEIMQDSSLLFMGTGYDAIMQVYYDSLYSSVTGQLSIAAYETSQGNNGTASQLVSASGGTSLMEDNRIQVYQIYLRSWALGVIEFTPLDSGLLNNIAMQHVKTGGTAVYDARVMLDLDVVDFDNGQARIATDAVTEPVNQSKVYPNPTTGEAVLEITLGDEQTGFVELLSLTGQRLFSVPLNAGANLAPLDLSGYAQGVYMYRIYINDEFTDAGRIIRND
jgi:hypothetical protein